eukprot:gene2680-1678_t
MNPTQPFNPSQPKAFSTAKTSTQRTNPKTQRNLNQIRQLECTTTKPTITCKRQILLAKPMFPPILNEYPTPNLKSSQQAHKQTHLNLKHKQTTLNPLNPANSTVSQPYLQKQLHPAHSYNKPNPKFVCSNQTPATGFRMTLSKSKVQSKVNKTSNQTKFKALMHILAQKYRISLDPSIHGNTHVHLPLSHTIVNYDIKPKGIKQSQPPTAKPRNSRTLAILHKHHHQTSQASKY